MTATARKSDESELFIAAMKSVSADCDAPTLITLTDNGDGITGRPEALPVGAPTADALPAILLDMARLIRRHPHMFDASVVGFGVVLPGERYAFAADRNGWCTYAVQLPGVATERFNAARDTGIRDGTKAMIRSLTAVS